ncbi:MAG: PilW family protein [Proteobacteria bacterium]|nr:PilW family protein [Pseudomonadota bacterium]
MRRGNQQNGFSLVELMVGVIIGLLAMYASFRIFENVERNYRATETTNEAQMAGLYATFAVSQELSNAGAGVMSNFGSFQACTAVSVFPNNDAGSSPIPLYPLPAAIIPADGGLSDDLFVFYGTGNFTDLPMSVTEIHTPQRFSLAAPLGLANGSILLAATGTHCAAFSAQTVTPPDDSGRVDVTIGAGQFLGSMSAGDSLVDMGNVVRRRFFVDENETLQMEIWQVDAAAGNNHWQVTRTVPVASNVVAFKAQYGVAMTSGGVADAWITPDATTLDQIMSGTISARDIRAIRFGLIVRAAEPDIALAEAPDITETFFVDCPGGWTCSAPQDIPLVVSKSDQPYGWRYRKYETTVPLQNTIWN